MAGLKKYWQIIDPFTTLQIQTAPQGLAVKILKFLQYLAVGS
jgi:hypothetical protein